ncbi:MULTISPECIES: phage/plasmid primase, P4 family [Arthrobacter]|nr:MULTISPECIES: phage/plasmid primase, P4 family [Arthrobacter]MBT8162920.1 hypothetical protein [Arthrobacter sp. GN70]
MTTFEDDLSVFPNDGNGPEGAVSTPATMARFAFLEELQEFFTRRSEAAAPLNFIITHVTAAYLDSLDPADAPAPRVLEQELLAAGNLIIKAENRKIGKDEPRYPIARQLSCWQLAQVLLRLHHVVRIAPVNQSTDREYDLLAAYQAVGSRRGTYTPSEDDIRTTARRYNTALTLNEFKEVLAVLREDSPRVHLLTHRDLSAQNNGVLYYGAEPLDLDVGGRQFHFEPKKIHPFDPALVYLAKASVNYVEDAPVQVISHPDRDDWEVVAWINSLFDQPDQEGLAELIWEIIGAIVRPHVRWGKTAWFYSEKGNNGKGTLCALMRNLVGDGTHTSIPLSDFGRNFALEPLMRANAVIVDENDVGTLIDKAANLKAIVTGDVIQIDRKHRMPVAFQFHGFMVQCLNEFPRAKDKSESFYRRQLFVPFAKSFTGAERKYIKDDYLRRHEVLEYVLWYAVNRAGAGSPGNYYQLSEPAATKAVLEEYKETNDPVRAFWTEFRDRIIWDLQPFPFLYDLHKAWFTDVSPSGSPVSRQKFVSNLVAIVDEDPDWHCPDKNRKIRPGVMMDGPEPLIGEFGLKSWYSRTYTGNDPFKLGRPVLQASYRGLMRRTLSAPAAPASAGLSGSEETA